MSERIDPDMDRVIRYVVVVCVLAEALIVFLDIFSNLAEVWYFEKFNQLSDIAQEKSFGTWFSVVQNFVIGLTALAISLHFRSVSLKKGRFWAWLLVAVFFIYVSVDDDLMLHERFSGTLGPLFMNWFFEKSVDLPTYEWLFLLGPFFGAFGVFFLVFLLREFPSRRSRLLLAAALGLWTMAVLMDAWEGTREAYSGLATTMGVKELKVRHFFMLIEETVEMLGSTLFLYLFLSRFRDLNRMGHSSG